MTLQFSFFILLDMTKYFSWVHQSSNHLRRHVFTAAHTR